MSLDRDVTINIGGKERKMKFTAIALVQLEKQLDEHNVYKMLADGRIALGDLAKCLFVGLRTYDQKITLNAVYGWLDEWLMDNSLETLQNLVLIALSKGGVFGNARNVIEAAAPEDAAGDTGK